MEIDWGGKFNYTSCGHPMANWQGHETHPTGHKTSEVDWGGHDPNGSDMLEGVVATRRTSGQTVCPRVCSYVLVTLEVDLARN